MPTKRAEPEPVTESEVCRAVKEALLTSFGDRPLDPEVARRGLAHAAFDLIQLQLEEAARTRSGSVTGSASSGSSAAGTPGASSSPGRSRPERRARP